MQEQQVETIDTKLAGTFVERVQRGLVAVIADPHFGLDEHVIALNTRLTHPLSDLPLIAVRRRRVDEPIPLSNRGFDGGARLFRRALKYAEAERGYLNAVVEREEWTRARHLCSPSASPAAAVGYSANEIVGCPRRIGARLRSVTESR